MKHYLIVLLLISALVQAGEPENTALKFNQWYIGQLNQGKSPQTDFAGLKPYITTTTINAVRQLYTGDTENKDMPDADMFIKAQGWDEDWVTDIRVVSSDFDPVCVNVYIAFGKKTTACGD
jgi:hypothetical protein